MRACAGRRITAVLSVLVTLAGVLTAIAPSASAHPYPPLITGMSTHHGPYLGGNGFTVYGFHFSPSVVVTFGGVRARRVRYLSPRRLEVTAPARPDAGEVHVYVYTGAGRSSGTGASAFRYDPAPSIRAMSRHVGREDGTPRVRIYGHDFIDVQSVAVGTKRSTGFTVRSSQVIDAYLPEFFASDRHVRVITAAGSSDPDAAAGRYRYVAPPAITGISTPFGAVAGGTRVVIRGTSLGDLTSVQFGSAPATDVTSVSPTEIHATTTSHPEGVIHAIVTTPFGTSERTFADQFRYGEPQPVTRHAAQVDPSGDLSDVSCATATFCIAVDRHDQWLRSDDGGTTWTTPVLAAGGVGVSCSSPTFCMSVISNYASRFDGTTFARPFMTVDGVNGLNAVSCPSADFCLAADGSERTTIWNATSWSAPERPFGEYITAISCWAAQECAAVDRNDSHVIVLRDGVWQSPVYVGSSVQDSGPERTGERLAGIECPDADTCFIGTDAGTVLTVSPRTVSTDTPDADRASAAFAVLPEITRITCADATSCLAIGPDGGDLDHPSGLSYIAIWDGTRWSVPVTTTSSVADGSCPVPGHCVLVGGSSTTTLDW